MNCHVFDFIHSNSECVFVAYGTYWIDVLNYIPIAIIAVLGVINFHILRFAWFCKNRYVIFPLIIEYVHNGVFDIVLDRSINVHGKLIPVCIECRIAAEQTIYTLCYIYRKLTLFFVLCLCVVFTVNTFQHTAIGFRIRKIIKENKIAMNGDTARPEE